MVVNIVLKKKPPDVEEDLEPSTKKWTRPDRKKKMEERKGTKETVVKACLLKLITHPEKYKLRDMFRKRIEVFSKRYQIASLCVLDFLQELVDSKDVSDIHIPNVLFNPTAIRTFMLGTEVCRKECDPMILEYASKHPEMFQNIVRFEGDSNSYVFGAVKLITNMKVHLKTTLINRIKQFVNRYSKHYNLSKEQRSSFLFLTHGWSLPDNLKETSLTLSSEVHNMIKLQRNLLGLEEGKQITDGWFRFDTNLLNIWRYFVFLNRFYETHKMPAFTMAPIAKTKAHFMTIDSLCLHGIMKSEKLITCSLSDFKENKMLHWKQLFNFEKLQGKNNTFTGTIDTDGTSVCLHFLRPINTSDHESYSVQENNRVVTIDPGRTNIYYAIEQSGCDFKSYKLSRRQYRKESGMVEANHKTIVWNKGIQKELEMLSANSPKGCNLATHKQFLKTFFQIYDTVWNEYFKPRWGQQRFRLYGGKKRVFANFFNRIKNEDPSKQVVMIFGAGKFAPGGKGEISVPTTRSFKECKYRFPTTLIDEFRTSKISCVDDTILQLVKKKDEDYALRGLMWSEKAKVFVNRDFNGAMNIRRRYFELAPMIMTRQKNQGCIVQKVGKLLPF